MGTTYSLNNLVSPYKHGFSGLNKLIANSKLSDAKLTKIITNSKKLYDIYKITNTDKIDPLFLLCKKKYRWNRNCFFNLIYFMTIILDYIAICKTRQI